MGISVCELISFFEVFSCLFLFLQTSGLPIAFASACAEYAYPHFGSPDKSEL